MNTGYNGRTTSRRCTKMGSTFLRRWCKWDCWKDFYLILKHVWFRNSKAAKINTGRRFKTYATIVPGPGAYEEAGMVANGVQVCSRFHSPLVKNLKTSSPRSRWGENPRFRTPGPGSYRPPSDFGYLQPKRAVRGYQGYGSLFNNTEPSKE